MFFCCLQREFVALSLTLSPPTTTQIISPPNPKVKVQQEKKYGGHSAAVELGRLDYVKFAEAFGATGHHVADGADFLPTLEAALDAGGVHVISVDVDYSDNAQLFKDVVDVDRFH